jgi:hypothetical protein
VANFVKLAATALRLIEKNGRAVSIRKVTTAVPPDPTKPWIPGVEVTADTACVGAFFDSDRSYITGQLIPEDTSLVLIAADGLGVTPIGKDRLVDGADVWEITSVGTLKPADVTLLFELMVKK